MNLLAPRRVVLLIVAFALVSLALPPAYADKDWTPDTSSADRYKTGKSGQVYSWREGNC